MLCIYLCFASIVAFRFQPAQLVLYMASRLSSDWRLWNGTLTLVVLVCVDLLLTVANETLVPRPSFLSVSDTSRHSLIASTSVWLCCSTSWTQDMVRGWALRCFRNNLHISWIYATRVRHLLCALDATVNGTWWLYACSACSTVWHTVLNLSCTRKLAALRVWGDLQDGGRASNLRASLNCAICTIHTGIIMCCSVHSIIL